MKNINILAPLFFCAMLCFYTIGCGSNATGGGGGGSGGGGGEAPFTADIWVSNTGTDTATGTYADPYKTITKAMSVVTTGETIGLYNGSYTETVTWAAVANVTLRGTSQNYTTIEGSELRRCIYIPDSVTTKGKVTIRDLTIEKGKLFGFGHGAGIYFDMSDNSTLNVSNVFFYKNVATTQGGAIYILSTAETHQIINCVFQENSAEASGGGAICVEYNNSGPAITPRCIVSSCEVFGNVSGGVGGGIDYYFASGRIENCLIYKNMTKLSVGGGLYFSGDGGTTPISTTEVVNCTIVSNEAPSQYGGGVVSNGNAIKIVNSIIWGNKCDPSYVSPPPYDLYSQTSTIEYSAIKAKETMWFNEGPSVTTEYPAFVTYPTGTIDLHLSASTPDSIKYGAKTAEATACDIEGKQRVAPPSMGAYEQD